MLSPDNGQTPYMACNKSSSGKFIIEKYAKVISHEDITVDLIVIYFMAIIFSQPPSSIYSATSPLEAYCSWLVESFISPNIECARKVVLCVDRKDLDKTFPLKTETHKIRSGKGKCFDFAKLFRFLLDKPVEMVSDTFVPSFSWISNNRDIRFELIFKAFEEIFNNPQKYRFPKVDFDLYVDGFYEGGLNVHTRILSKIGSNYVVTNSEFSVVLPESDQSMFLILKFLEFSSCSKTMTFF